MTTAMCNQWVKAASLLLSALVFTRCSDSPYSPESAVSSPTVSGPEVLVSGVPVRGVVSLGTGEPSLFRIRATSPAGPAGLRRVVMEYAQPGPNHHGGPMMGGFRGTILCYDDGTHGDDIPGDGIYQYIDPDNQIGCHGWRAPAGEYRYTFWCEDIYGQRSNDASITVIRR